MTRSIPQLGLNATGAPADERGVITSTWLLAPWAMLWVVLIRALLVQAQILPRTCRRCGRPLESADLHQELCSCRRR